MDRRADPKVRQAVDNIQGRFLERVAVRLENGLTEQELAEELIIEAFALTHASYGCVLRLSSDQQFQLDAVVTDKEGRLTPVQDSLSNRLPDELMQDVVATHKPAFSNDAANNMTVNLPDSHPPIHSFAVCPLVERTKVKAILLIANFKQPFDIHLMGRLQSTMNALIRIHINSIINRGMHQLVDAVGQINQQVVNLLKASFDSVITLNDQHTILSFNPASEQLFNTRAFDVLGSSMTLFLKKETLAEIQARHADFNARSESQYTQPYRFEYIAAHKADGSQFLVKLAAFFSHDKGQRVCTLVLREQRDTAKPMTALPDELLQYNALTSLIPVSILKLDQTWQCEYANEAWCELTGRSVEQNLDKGWIEALHVDDQSRMLVNMGRALLQGRRYCEILKLKSNSGEFINVGVKATSLADDDNPQSSTLVVITEITDQQQAAQQLKLLANHDTLTGLPNRTRFLEHLEGSLAELSTDDFVALLFIDLDGFKAVNDTLGHDAGDELLQQVARRIKHTVRENDTVARLGGDEFSVTLTTLEKGKHAGIVAKAITNSIKQPFILKTEEVYVSASIGIAISQGPVSDNSSTNALIKQADIALYQAKLSGRSRFIFFTAELDQAQRDRSVLITSLRKAVDRQDFELYYQPQLLIREQQLLGFEALLRWPQSLGEHISPADFIDVLEDTGLIGELGEWAIGQACSQHRIWLDRGLIGPAATMSVNVSARQLGMPNFADSVAAVLHNRSMRPDSLILEITESALVQTFESNIINDLRSLGVQISLDDFGTGYSSLAYLSQLPVDHLKIDRSFIADIVRYPHAVTVVKSIIALANTLGIRVIAEGVEDGSVLPLLEKEGCEGYQGYFYSQPLPSQAMTVKLQHMETVRLSHYANFIDLDDSMVG